MRITMIGSGYVGLVSGACLADFGHEVTCIDSNAEKIAALKRGEIPIYEPGLDQLVKDNTAAARMFFSNDLAAAVGNSDVVFIAVGTPPARVTGMPIFPMFTQLPAKSLSHSRASRLWPQNRQFHWELVTKLSASSARSTLLPMWLWCQIRNFCARVRQSAISKSQTVS